MEIWLIRDGEKSGPFPDYEIRSRIAAGELESTDPAWHEGLAAWTPLEKIPVFHGEFRAPEIAEPEPAAEPSVQTTAPSAPPPIPGNPRIIRRFCARLFDIHIYVAVWWFLFWLARADIGSLLTNTFVAFTQLVPWVVIETLLIHRFATTPGKWLMGIRVLNSDGTQLSLSQSVRRALRVLTVGIGFGIPWVILFCMGLSAYTALKIKSTVWDHLGSHRIAASPFAPWKIGLLSVLFLASVFLQVSVTGPYAMELFRKNLNTPESEPIKKFFEKDPEWFLPRRDR